MFYNNISRYLRSGVVAVSALILSVTPLITSFQASAQGTATIFQIASTTPATSTLASVLVETGLNSTLNGAGPFTVFAPTNDAFANLGPKAIRLLTAPANRALLSDILLYHVVSGDVSAATARTLTTANSVQGDALAISNPAGVLTINSSIVTTEDVLATNGRVHLIDRVLLSPSLTTRFTTLLDANNTITDLVIDTPTTATLESLVIGANLATTLAGVGPFTVFAPTDSAFARLSVAQRAVLTNTANVALLTDILRYHVVSGNVTAATARTLTTANSVQGDALAISNPSGVLTINSSVVTTEDIVASNGRVHLIDAVLLSTALAARLTAAVNAAAVSSASSVSSVSSSISTVVSSSRTSSSPATTLIRSGGSSSFQIGLLLSSIIVLVIGAFKVLSSKRS